MESSLGIFKYSLSFVAMVTLIVGSIIVLPFGEITGYDQSTEKLGRKRAILISSPYRLEGNNLEELLGIYFLVLLYRSPLKFISKFKRLPDL